LAGDGLALNRLALAKNGWLWFTGVFVNVSAGIEDSSW